MRAMRKMIRRCNEKNSANQSAEFFICAQPLAKVVLLSVNVSSLWIKSMFKAKGNSAADRYERLKTRTMQQTVAEYKDKATLRRNAKD